MTYFVVTANPGAARHTAPPSPLPTVSVTNDALHIDWIVPAPQWTYDPAGVSHITIEGYAQSDRPGQPRLPFTSILIALPAESRPELHVIAHEETNHRLNAPLARAPYPQGVHRDAQGQPIGGAYVPATETAPGAAASVQFERIGVVRGIHLARLTFHPIRLVDQQLRITSRLQLALDFNRQSQIANPQSKIANRQSAIEDRFIQSIRSIVVNPEHVEASIANPQAPVSNLQSSSLTAVEVITPGLTALTYNALHDAGFPVTSADPRLLHLTHHGQAVAAEWSGDNDTQFEPGERLLFYADPQFSRYTPTDTYFLSVENTPGLRMSTRSANPTGLPAGLATTTAHFESNAHYTPNCFCGSLPAGHDGDRWAWDVLRRPDRAQADYSVALPAVRTPQPATLTLWLIGYTDVAASPDHRIAVKINGATLGRIEWDGRQAITSTLPISPGILNTATNTVTFNLPGVAGVAVEGAWLDAFEIHYARSSAALGHSATFSGVAAQRAYTVALQSTAGLRVYDISDADQPLRLTGLAINGNNITLGDAPGGSIHQYHMAADGGVLSPSNMRIVKSLKPVSGADLIIISPAQFMSALTPLINLRAAQGLSVVAEDLQSIYDAFGFGRAEPDALHAYLQNAYDTWNPRPAYVLLVGDGAYDPKRYKSDTSVTWIPPYLVDVDPWAGETAADNRYAAVDGDDALPDLLLGRLPVNSLSETQIVVNKIVHYETQPFPGGWNKYVTFVADDPDSAGDYRAASNSLAASFVHTPFVAESIYYGLPGNTVNAVQQAIRSRWTQGAGLIMFNGHASFIDW
jgi:hypothetical protein